MDGTQNYHVKKLENPESSFLPDWIRRVLRNTEEGEAFEDEHHIETSEVSLQIARWNLRIAQELIQQGLWSPSSEDRKTLHKLNLKYKMSSLS